MSVDIILQERETAGQPIRVGMIGAGATGRAIALQLGTPVPGIRLVAVANRTPEHGERAYREAGITAWTRATTTHEAEASISRGIPVLTDDPSVVTQCGLVDIIVEVTGTVAPAARVALDAMDHGKNIVLAGTSMVAGQAKAVVFATGMHTEFGKIAHLTQTAGEAVSPLGKELAHLSRLIAGLAILIGFLFFAIGRMIGVSFWQE